MNVQEFRTLLLTNGTDLEFLAAEYRRLWEDNDRMSRHVTALQEVSTALMNQKRAWQRLAKDFIVDLREWKAIQAGTIIQHLPLIKDLVD